MRRLIFALVLVLAAGLTTTPAFAQDLAEAVETDQQMVVTANPLATAAGELVLNSGGTVADAFVAVQTVLGLVEPQSSGIGGGAFAVYYDADSGETTTYDARETTPAAATEDRFDGLGFLEAWQSGLSVGVPGTPALMEALHANHGRLSWSTLFGPARDLAAGGFEITGRTADQVNFLLGLSAFVDGAEKCEDRLFFRDPVAYDYFVEEFEVDSGTETVTDCAAKPAGTSITNADYASLMDLLATDGAAAFYTGDLATDIADAVTGDLNIPGDMTTDDLAAYEVIEREPVCQEYRGRQVCGMGPPSSGALAVGQILGILANVELGDGPLDELTVHNYTQAMRLAFADRNLYVGDTDFVTVPVEGMLDEDYLAERSELIGEDDISAGAEPGTPPGEFDPSAPQAEDTEGGTSHVSIVDRFGNALSVTTTIESSFGNGVMVESGGFLLNNELTDFSFDFEDDEGDPIANRVQPGKRPRSSMSPTIVLGADGTPEIVTGSPGGSRIIGYTAQSIINMLDFDLDPQQAIQVPHYMNRNGSTTDLEAPLPGIIQEYDVDGLTEDLEARGHTVSVTEQTSGLSIIQITDDGLIGGADLRRDGAVGGQEPELGVQGVNRIDGGDGQPVTTAIEICQELVEDGEADSLALARDDVFADALTGSALPVDCILFTAGGPDAELDSETETEIERALRDDGIVYVLGGPNAVSVTAEAAVPGATERIAGTTRFETAEMVSAEALDARSMMMDTGTDTGTDTDTPSDTMLSDVVIVADGLDWVDAITSGGFSSATGTPIVLTAPGGLHPAAERFISGQRDTNADTQVVIVGGVDAVDTANETEIGESERVAGGNRMSTAAAIAAGLWPAVPASGEDFLFADLEGDDAWPVALAGAPLAALLDAPILGVRTDNTPVETTDYISSLGLTEYPSVTILGDENLISADVANDIADAVTPQE